MADPELLGERYQLRGLLGTGGMAEVHAGWDVRLNRPVAVKLLHRTLLADRDSRARFAFEAQAAAALSHPNIVVVHDSGEHPGPGGVPYLVMEQLPGTSLAEVIARGPLPVDRARAVLGDVLAGLSAAHAAGILHRDVKPSNVLFGPTGEAKLADFGIAKSTARDLTQVGQVIGTLAYLSPERIAGAPATPADDLYAVGVMSYEALTGRTPTRPVVPLSVARPDVDPVLAGVIERAMAPDPAVRFASAAAMRDALRAVRPPTRVLGAPPVGPLPLTGAVPPPPPPSQRRRLLVVAAAALAVLLALVLAIAEAMTSDGGGGSTPTPTTSSTTTTTTSPTTTTTTTTTPFVQAPLPPQPPRERPGRGNEGKPEKPRKGDDG